ncbi:MAG: glutathione peroxidase [Fibrobacteres bacterium]|nr:glutathione peroxidase [Fibrobacterota bacterium]
MSKIHDIAIRRADKSETTLGEFKGKVLLIVNVASKCGLTPQYEGLERLYEKYAGQGLTVLGFPANEFGAQEPGTDADIQQFCTLNFGVKFPVLSKLVVKGPGQHPLYAHLTSEFPEATKKGSAVRKVLRKMVHPGSFTGDSGEITWNFEKFLVDREGDVVARFAPDVLPEDPMVIESIEEELAKA